MRTEIFIILLINLMLGCMTKTHSQQTISPPTQPTTMVPQPPTVCVGGKSCVEVEIADEPYERMLGLMYRNNLEENKGMLFIFQTPGYPSFYMKNMRFPLDILWFDENYKLIYIHENLPPCGFDPCPTYTPHDPQSPIKYVLEVNAGWVKRNNIKIGDEAEFNINSYL